MLRVDSFSGAHGCSFFQHASPARNSSAFHIADLRFPWCGGGLISLSLAVAEIICFVQKRRFEIVYFVHLVS